MKSLAVFYILLIPGLGVSQVKFTGIINATDGYTNIRAGRGTHHEIVGKILNNELFTYYEDLDPDEEWLKVSVTKYSFDEPLGLDNKISGFIHRSQIIRVETLDPERKRILIASIFHEEKQLYEKVINAHHITAMEYQMLKDEMVVHHLFQFAPALQLFAKHVCTEKDRNLLDLYLKLLVIQEDSTDELLSYTLAWILSCEADWMFESMSKYPSLFSKLEWGIVNIDSNNDINGHSKLEKKYNELLLAHGYQAADFSKYGK